MTETKAQEKCPFCHYNNGIQMLIKGKRQSVSIMPRTHYKLGVMEFNGEPDMVSIHYCPMCGRKLEAGK